MKKILLILCTLAFFQSPQVLFSQTFMPTSDTVWLTPGLNYPLTGFDSIYSTSSNPVTLNWSVTASNFPSSWLPYIGLCDNYDCYDNLLVTNPPLQLWNGSSGYQTYTSKPYLSPGLFYLVVSCPTVISSNLCYYLTVTFKDAANSSSQKTITFTLCQSNTTSASTIPKPLFEVSLYPNPANEEVNIVYDTQAGVKTIAIYNLIGKVVSVFRPLDNSSAKLSLDNVPAGIYFVRLMDAQGAVIGSHKFTHR